MASSITTEEVEMADADKVHENRLRRMAARQGLTLQKSRLRDPRAIGYGTYQLTDGSNLVAWGSQSGYGLTLDEVEKYLTE
jgi:hypothetical protein